MSTKLIIELYYGKTYGEPGPNLVIRGTLEGISILIEKIKILLDSCNEVVMKKTEDVTFVGLSELVLKSSTSGNVISKIENDNDRVVIDLSLSLWRKGFHMLDGLETKYGFQYFEFDDVDDLVEDANVIVHSLPIEKLLVLAHT